MRLWMIVQVIIFFNSVYGSSGIVDPSKLSVQHSYGAHGPFVERGPLGAEDGVYVDSDEFRKLIVEGGLYRLKISNGNQCIVTSVRACDLYKAGLKEKLVLHTDKQQENVVGVDYAPSHGLVSRLRSCQADKLNIPNGNIPIGTTIKVSPAVPAQLIPVQAVGPHPPGFKMANPDGKEDPQPQHQSFFIKYWYVFLPVLLMIVLGGGTPPEQQGQGGGNAQSGGSNAAAQS